VIPSFCVDAVCEVPYGSYPGNMQGEYYSDEEHLGQWLQVERNEADFKAFLDKYVYGVPDFSSYLQLCGGTERIQALRAQELLLPERARDDGGL
jgi:glutaconate CoA-transferase subunit A